MFVFVICLSPYGHLTFTVMWWSRFQLVCQVDDALPFAFATGTLNLRLDFYRIVTHAIGHDKSAKCSEQQRQLQQRVTCVASLFAAVNFLILIWLKIFATLAHKHTHHHRLSSKSCSVATVCEFKVKRSIEAFHYVTSAQYVRRFALYVLVVKG